MRAGLGAALCGVGELLEEGSSGGQRADTLPSLQWMVPTIQNSMKPFKVSRQALAGWGLRAGPREPAAPCLRRTWTTPASSSAS